MPAALHLFPYSAAFIHTHTGFGVATVLFVSFLSEHFSGFLKSAPRIVSLVYTDVNGGKGRAKVAVTLAGTGQRMTKGETNIFLILKYWDFCAQQILMKCFFFIFINSVKHSYATAYTHVHIYRERWNQFRFWSMINFYTFEDFSLPKLDWKLNSLYMCIYALLYCTPSEINLNDLQEDCPANLFLIQH